MKDMMILQPYYMIDFNASACLFEIRINDYPVIHMNIEGQVSSMIPINYAILATGVQTITATILPCVGSTQLHSKAVLRFDIKLFDVSNDFIFNKQFGDYQSESIGDKKLPIISYTNSFFAEIPYKLDAWQKGKNLKDINDLRKKIELAYNYIVQIIDNKQYDTFKQIISKRERNMAVSMYLTNTEAEKRLAELIEDFELGFTTKPISKEALMILYGNNKVAMLKKINGESALCLENKKTNEELMLDISFYIPEGKEEFEVI